MTIHNHQNEGESAQAVIFDPYVFNELTAGDRAVQREVSEIFSKQLTQLRAEIDSILLIESDVLRRESIEKFAHKLRGVAKSLAAPALEIRASDLERVAFSGKPVVSVFDALFDELKLVANALEKYVSDD